MINSKLFGETLTHRVQRPPPELNSIIFLKRPSNYSAGLARVNSTSDPSATLQERSIFRPVGWVEIFGPLMYGPNSMVHLVLKERTHGVFE